MFYLITGFIIILLFYLWLSQNKKNEKKILSRVDAVMKKILHEKQSEHNQYDPAPLKKFKHLDAEQKKQKKMSITPSWKHDRLGIFYQKHINPYKKILRAGGYLAPINSLFFLIDEHGDCPSVIKLDYDMEYQMSENQYGMLAKISLFEHTLNVAEQIVANMNNAGNKDPKLFMGKMLVAALGHDIGKISTLTDSQQYSENNHSYISFLVLKKVILPNTLSQKQEIITAVKEHHYHQVREGLASALKTADHNARELEIDILSKQGAATSGLVEKTQEQKVKSKKALEVKKKRPKGTAPQKIDLSWLDIEDFLAEAEPEINKTDGKGHFRAFSINCGLVYLMLDVVTEKVFVCAEKKGLHGILVGTPIKEKKRNIVYTVKIMLDEKKFIPSFIGKSYFGAMFALIDQTGKRRLSGVYMPIDVKAFKTSLVNLEKRKLQDSILPQIAEAQPLIGRKQR